MKLYPKAIIADKNSGFVLLYDYFYFIINKEMYVSKYSPIIFQKKNIIEVIASFFKDYFLAFTFYTFFTITLSNYIFRLSKYISKILKKCVLSISLF